ncbi:hypothetical protein P43SY_002288 [Pythium insidiosum]|uniref:Transmembrane protein n=1 Tax=Pythium insidiosum TaxID=114742 RepID=A0AAD5LTI5_PYTIN|nr:hypothetical protein P43SY_002288 [Pythium insidiosum]
MLTRARARATNRPVFVDDQWNDAYIQTKDEQIEMLHAQGMLQGWGDGHGEHDDSDTSDEEDEDADRWRSDDGDDSDEDDEDGRTDAAVAHDADAAVDGSGGGSQEPEQRRASTWLSGGSYWENVLWTAMAVTVVPAALYAAFRGHNKRGGFALDSSSARAAVLKAYTNVLSLSLALLLTLAAVARVAGGPVGILSAWSTLWWPRVLLEESQSRVALFAGASRRSLDAVASVTQLWRECGSVIHGLVFDPVDDGVLWVEPTTLCRDLPALRSALVSATAASLLLFVVFAQFHRLWFKVLVFSTVAAVVARDISTQLESQRLAAVEIFALDPPFAFVNESIFVAVDGQNLAQGATISWLPYWGGLHESQDPQQHPRLFGEPLQHGGVLVTFDAVNDYVPCYSRASKPRETTVCFEQLRLRVKDRKSVPGWSLHHRSSGGHAATRPVDT